MDPGHRVMAATSKATKLPVNMVQQTFNQRLKHPKAYPQMKVRYGKMTWLVDTPQLLNYHYGTDKVNAEKASYWTKLRNTSDRIQLVIGLFAEEQMKCEVVRQKCPRCGGKTAFSGYENIPQQIKRMEKVCWGGGYHRTILIR